jgi:hypothetical protein
MEGRRLSTFNERLGMRLELRPAAEAVLARKRVLRVGEFGVRILLTKPPQQILRLFAEMREAWTRW